MKTAVLSDIHGNLAALEAVIRDIEKRGGADQFWSLGDIIDYGPEPHLCLERIRQLNAVGIVGNHEYAVAGKMDLREFRAEVAVVTNWTRQQMSEQDLAFILALPLTLETGDFTLAHGSPRDPLREYVLSDADAAENWSYFKTRCCLIGHTHVPLCFKIKDVHDTGQGLNHLRSTNLNSLSDWNELIRQNRNRECKIELTKGRFIFNPGSVGQPRDHDPRAAYALIDSTANTLELRRVEYDIAATRRRMAELKLPEWLSSRLSEGL
ncbi:MAG TPA: metallophosphoesterase family protein [Dehalococcoidales bacterium]|nr:metallophosphoesterase family protein [Dehalococcoidales bacterium]